MRFEMRWIVAALSFALVAGTAVSQQNPPPPPPASDDEDEDAIPPKPDPDDPDAPEAEGARGERFWGALYFEANVWMAQPSGLGYSPATEYDGNAFGTARVLDPSFATEPKAQAKVAWILPHGVGELVGSYYSVSQHVDFAGHTPGDYRFGETQVLPLFSGAFDNGLADAFESRTRTRLREFRIDFARVAVDAPHFRAKWFAGLRRVNHTWDVSTAYYSIVQPPDVFPPLIPPLGFPDLVPLADVSTSVADYEGRGIETGVDFQFPFGSKGNFSFEAGIAVAAVRGTAHSQYSSLTWAYTLFYPRLAPVIVSPADFTVLLVDPRDDPENPVLPPVTLASLTDQVGYFVGLDAQGVSQSATILEGYMGFRWKAYKGLELFAGLRDTRYDGVGEEIRPTSVVHTPNGLVNVQSMSRTPVSPTYEGFYVGLGFRY